VLAALPNFTLRVYDLQIPGIGSVPIDPWATLVCIGFVVGLELARARGIRLGLDVRDVVDGAVFIVLMGFFVAHVFVVLFYFPDRMRLDGAFHPLTALAAILRVWQGFASTGGFVGAVIGAIVFYSWIRPRDAWRHADVITYGFPFGWFFGRLGCGVVHDHIGSRTTWPIGMDFGPDGVRHELGLYEAALMVPIMLVFWRLGRQDQRPGTFLALFGMAYAPIRFGLDFLRNADLEHTDARYFGLTPAQYGMVLMFGAATLLWVRVRRAPFAPVPLQDAATP
jgi:phosphatidylglycerol:prolipoprotein diacylglycerol transferase